MGGWNIIEHRSLRQVEMWTDQSLPVPDASSMHWILKI